MKKFLSIIALSGLLMAGQARSGFDAVDRAACLFGEAIVLCSGIVTIQASEDMFDKGDKSPFSKLCWGDANLLRLLGVMTAAIGGCAILVGLFKR